MGVNFGPPGVIVALLYAAFVLYKIAMLMYSLTWKEHLKALFGMVFLGVLGMIVYNLVLMEDVGYAWFALALVMWLIDKWYYRKEE